MQTREKERLRDAFKLSALIALRILTINPQIINRCRGDFATSFSYRCVE